MTESNDVQALEQIISVLKPLESLDRRRILETVQVFFQAERQPSNSANRDKPVDSFGHSKNSGIKFSDETTLLPKQFLLEKQPRTDVERVACLAYYLTHYRSIPHFKTLDISKLNTEAAQPKFSSASVAVNNATLLGYLVPAQKGQKQLSATGEQFVLALPDRSAAQAVIKKARPRRKSGKKKSNNKRK